MNSPRSQVEFVTRLAYNLEGLSGKLKLYFSQFLSFHFADRLSREQIQHIENKKAGRPFADDNEILEASRDFTTDEKVWVVATLLVLKSESESVDDRVISIKLDATIRSVVRLLELENEEARIQTEKHRLESDVKRFQDRKLIQVPMSIELLSIDYALRWVVLLFFAHIDVEGWSVIEFNFFFIPLAIASLGYRAGRRIRADNKRLLERYGGAENFRVEYFLSTSQYTWLAFFIASSVYIGFLLPDQLHWFALAGFSVYYFLYIKFLSAGRIDENELVRQLAQDEQKLSTLNRDENDEVIVGLETKLNSLTGRLEAYVLESALFGALTFSGFLQIMSSELVTFDALENFVNSIFEASRAVIYFDVSAFGAAATSLNNKVSLFCLVSVESLLCSVFFLAVIASRLRFSNVADRVRTAINLAKAYNDKEEALYHEEDVSEKRSARLVALNTKVNEQLQATVGAMREVDPIMIYMQYFRNAGLLVFLIILVNSTLFITSVVGWAFIALVFATYLYFNRKTIAHSIAVGYMGLRIQFSRKSPWFLAAALFPFVMGSIVRDWLLWPGGQSFVALGYLTTGLYIFLWLMLAAHVDDEFGEIDTSKVSRRIGRWKLVKGLLAALILAYCFSMAMKYKHLSGANLTAMISLSSLSVVLYFVGYYTAKIRWLGVVAGGMMATFSIGILFKSLHLFGANEMLNIGVIAITVLIPILIWQRKKFHILFMKFCIAAYLIGLTFQSGIFLRYTIAASHRTWHVERIMDVMGNRFDEDLAGCMQRSDWYMAEYGTRHGFDDVYAPLMWRYSDYCRLTVLGPGVKQDSALQKALIVARQWHKIESMFGYDTALIDPDSIGLEAEVLVAMNQKEEAIQSLERIMNENPPADVREIVRKKISSIREAG